MTLDHTQRGEHARGVAALTARPHEVLREVVGVRAVTVAELMVLARALNVAPVALLYPGPYDGDIEMLPDVAQSETFALQWFSGLVGIPRPEIADE
jgi:hypothetical protein